MPTPFGPDGHACVIAGQPVVLELELLNPDGTAQDYDGRTFAWQVYQPGSGTVSFNIEGAVVTEDGHTFVRFALTGEQTAGVDLSVGPGLNRMARLQHEVGEVLDTGFSPIPLTSDGRVPLYPFTILGAGSPTGLPTPGEGTEGPSTRYVVTPGNPNRVVIQYRGAPGVSAKQTVIDAGDLPADATDEDFAAWLREDAEAAAATATAAAADAAAATTAANAATAAADAAAASATSAAAAATSAASSATTAAGQANTARDAANAAATAATSAASAATAAATSATTASSAANAAATLANAKAALAQTAATGADTSAAAATAAASAANTAKTAADTATAAANTATTAANTATSAANTATSAANTATTAANAAASSATTAAATANAAAATALDLTPIDVSTTTYTLQTSDNGKVLGFSNAAGCTVTLPNSLAIGWNAVLCQTAAGQVTLSPASGATLRQASALTKTRVQWSELGLRVRTNAGGVAAEYVASGDMA